MTRTGRRSVRAPQQVAPWVAALLIAFSLLAGFHHHGLDVTQSSEDDCAVCQVSRKAGILPDAAPIVRPLADQGEVILAVSSPLSPLDRHPTASRAPPASAS